MSSECHDCTGRCICTEEEEDDYDGDVVTIVNPECPVMGHSEAVSRVDFTDDGAQVVSASADNSVRLWDVASGRQVRQLTGRRFALVEGLSSEHQEDRHFITGLNDKLWIHEIGKGQQHAEGVAVEAPVACFMAPQRIFSVHCFGATICVGCIGGAVCILSAPFLAA